MLFSLAVIGLSKFQVRKRLALGVSFTILFLIIFSVPVSQGLSQGSIAKHLYSGTIIWGLESPRLEMPELGNPSNSLLEATAYCSFYIIDCVKLFLTTLWAFLVFTRPGFSILHNMIILTVFPALYLFALIGGFRFAQQPITKIGAAMITVQLGLIGLSFASWAGRFLAYILPVITVFSGLRLYAAINLILNRFSHKRVLSV